MLTVHRNTCYTKYMIRNAADLTPETKWDETIWSCAREEKLADPLSKPRLCVAALLPFHDRKPDWQSFERMLIWMSDCAQHFGIDITFVLNADTGYVFNLSDSMYEEVIIRFRALYPRASFISGITAVGADTENFQASSYHSHLDIAQRARALRSHDYDLAGPEFFRSEKRRMPILK